MQYLSQRLASKPARRRDGVPPGGALRSPQRERILDAAERLAGGEGRGAASIEAIVKAAGVSTVSFYEHFEGKEECFVAVFDRALEEFETELGEKLGRGLTWPERVSTGLRALLAEVAARPERARLCLVEAQTGGPVLSARFEATLDRAARALRQGRALETAPAGLPETLEEATVGGVAWLLRERLERGEDGAAGVEDLYPKLVEIALAPYLSDG
ncbi:MAG: TetR/AcrR family transcriptional regulator [Thermoleophilaceae bacterium]